MIPVKLTLRNFMSYGEEAQTLDFDGIHVACLSGDNGHGKSALLDAMTYALWGKTRASGSAASGEDDLVRLGADETEVRFDFRLGGELYRVLRKRNRAKRAGDWQAQVSDGSGGWRPLGGTGARETEKQLARLLRMDYETFCNSAYLRQGHADEFTQKKPEARKQILADILDLRRYDRLEELAKERRSECALKAADLEGEIRLLDVEIAQRPEHEQKLKEHQAALAQWTAEREVRQKKLDELKAELAALEEKERRLRDSEARLGEAERELPDLDALIKRLKDRTAECSALLEGREAIEDGFKRLLEARRLIQQLEPEVRALGESRQEREAVLGKLALRRSELRADLNRAEGELKRCREEIVRIEEFKKRLAQLAPQLAKVAQSEAKLQQTVSTIDESRKLFEKLRGRKNQLDGETKEIDDVLDLLRGDNPVCKVCGSDLSGGKRQAVIKKQESRKTETAAAVEEIKQQGIAEKKKLEELEKRRLEIDAQLRTAAQLRAQESELNRQIADSKACKAAESAAIKAAEDLRTRVEKDDYGAAERASLKELEKVIARLSADAVRFEEARGTEKELISRQVETLHAQLTEAERNRTESESELKRCEERRTKLAAQIESQSKAVQALRRELAGIESLRRTAEQAGKSLEEAVQSCERERAEEARCAHALERCEKARKDREKKNIDHQAALKDKQAYTELAAAFGKKGVQALIIDNALPEIEEEANRLLARMTDNAMNVTMKTQRSARSGSGQIETLDIRITDDAGMRPYEMYSGGEAFRVNFAIRIALSRLLAKRAQAQLETLIIDEGFGTQDARGRERLVEAIGSVRDEFAKILVITHVEELKDAFPTRIEITKTPDGSRITHMD